MIVLVLGMALAAEPSSSVRFAIRGVAEQWSDPAVATVYRSGAPLGAIGIGVPLSRAFAVDLEVGYRRLSSQDDESLLFELAPLSALAVWTPGQEDVTPFVAAGPTVTAWSERYAPGADGLGATSGARIAGELRVGLRVDTGLIRPAAPPAPAPVKDLSIEVYVGRRQARPLGARSGFDLGAWRAAIGLSVGL